MGLNYEAYLCTTDKLNRGAYLNFSLMIWPRFAKLSFHQSLLIYSSGKYSMVTSVQPYVNKFLWYKEVIEPNVKVLVDRSKYGKNLKFLFLKIYSYWCTISLLTIAQT